MKLCIKTKPVTAADDATVLYMSDSWASYRKTKKLDTVDSRHVVPLNPPLFLRGSRVFMYIRVKILIDARNSILLEQWFFLNINLFKLTILFDRKQFLPLKYIIIIIVGILSPFFSWSLRGYFVCFASFRLLGKYIFQFYNNCSPSSFFL